MRRVILFTLLVASYAAVGCGEVSGPDVRTMDWVGRWSIENPRFMTDPGTGFGCGSFGFPFDIADIDAGDNYQLVHIEYDSLWHATERLVTSGVVERSRSTLTFHPTDNTTRLAAPPGCPVTVTISFPLRFTVEDTLFSRGGGLCCRDCGSGNSYISQTWERTLVSRDVTGSLWESNEPVRTLVVEFSRHWSSGCP